jgi:hypothetical protein
VRQVQQKGSWICGRGEAEGAERSPLGRAWRSGGGLTISGSAGCSRARVAGSTTGRCTASIVKSNSCYDAANGAMRMGNTNAGSRFYGHQSTLVPRSRCRCTEAGDHLPFTPAQEHGNGASIRRPHVFVADIDSDGALFLDKGDILSRVESCHKGAYAHCLFTRYVQIVFLAFHWSFLW